MNSFEELLKKQKNSGLSDIVDAAKKASSYGDGKDTRFWRPTVDKSGNAQTVIRFLPASDQDIPWAKFYEHSFKSPISNRWYWENCPTTIGENCPVCEQNSLKWNAGVDELKEVARARKRKLHYVSNIVVIQDAAEPENNGKVFLFKFGTKIFEKIMTAMEPAFDDEEAFNPFNLFSGASFKLRVKTVDRYPNYDSSEFSKVEPLFGGNEDRMKEVFDQIHPLKEFTDPASFKPYTDLRKKYFEITGERDTSMDGVESFSAPKQKGDNRSSEEPDDLPISSLGAQAEDDEDIAYFQRLAAES
jgi:hypothetical protein